MKNLHQRVTVDDLYELFGLRSTNYLRNNCHIVMDHFINVDQPFASATVTAPVHVCEELLKLHGIVFHGNPLVTEMSKSPLEQSNHYSQPPLQPPPIQQVINSYENAVNPRRKDIVLFPDGIPKLQILAKITILAKYLSRLYYHQSEPKPIYHKSMKP